MSLIMTLSILVLCYCYWLSTDKSPLGSGLSQVSNCIIYEKTWDDSIYSIKDGISPQGQR